MKKLFVICALSLSSISFAQNGRVGLQFNAGAHLLGEAGNGLTMNGGVSYNFVPSFGLKLDGGLDLIGENSLNRLGLQLTLNPIKFFNQDAKFGLELHGGAALINNGNYTYNDTYLLRGDDMVAIMAGLTPSFKISDHVQIQLDATYIPKMYQVDGIITKFLNTTVGIGYRF